jgi:leucyl/phenylalanyl-tRNA--protein transferase
VTPDMPFQDMLNPELIIAAYRGGYFPMPDPDTGEILWFNPDPRAVIPLGNHHISRSLRKTARSRSFTITFDTDFVGVIEACGDRPSTWITPEIKAAYTRLFRFGIGHSVEVWDEQKQLVGGLYGLSQGGVFNAESMFSRATDTSKLALWALVERLKECGLTLLEVQFMTDHLRRLGAVEVPRAEYLRQLDRALALAVNFKAPHGVYNLL